MSPFLFFSCLFFLSLCIWTSGAADLAATAEADGEEVYVDAESAQRQEDAAGRETGVLEQTLEKLIALTQIGFGELSSSVISHSMTATGELDAGGEGARVAALFGVCRIPHFAEVCAALQGQARFVGGAGGAEVRDGGAIIAR